MLYKPFLLCGSPSASVLSFCTIYCLVSGNILHKKKNCRFTLFSSGFCPHFGVLLLHPSFLLPFFFPAQPARPFLAEPRKHVERRQHERHPPELPQRRQAPGIGHADRGAGASVRTAVLNSPPHHARTNTRSVSHRTLMFISGVRNNRGHQGVNHLVRLSSEFLLL